MAARSFVWTYAVPSGHAYTRKRRLQGSRDRYRRASGLQPTSVQKRKKRMAKSSPLEAEYRAATKRRRKRRFQPFGLVQDRRGAKQYPPPLQALNGLQRFQMRALMAVL